jgi:transcriptional regulator with XRE-family HTH domain
MNLRAWRQSNKLTLIQAAEIFGISKSQLSALERGRYIPPIETQMRMDAATNGMVAPGDHAETWASAHPRVNQAERMAGRAAVRRILDPAKLRSNTHG